MRAMKAAVNSQLCFMIGTRTLEAPGECAMSSRKERSEQRIIFETEALARPEE